MNFVDMIFYYGRSNPEKQAIILADRVVSYGMLMSGIRSVETAILEAGLNRSQTIAVRVESQTRHLIVVSALYRLGIVSVSVTGKEDLSQSGLKVDAVISDQNQVMPHLGKLIILKDDWFGRPFKPDAPRPAGFADDDLARIIMSSGTTAAPKAIGMSARVVEDRIITGRRTLALAPWDRMMCLPVLNSSLGFGSALQALAYGHALVFADTAMDALHMIALYNVDLLVANPQHLRAMVEEHRKTPIPTPSLRLIKFGGNAMAPDLVPQVRARLCKDVMCVYSSTESGPVAFDHIDRLLDVPGSTGHLAPWIDVEIIGPDDTPVAAGIEGRLRVRSQWQGYDLAVGKQAAHDWMYPGDIGKISDDRMLSLIGRFADAIVIDGQYVAPEQLEQVLIGHPGVVDVAVISMPTPNGQTEMWATVISNQMLDETAMQNLLLAKNPRWKLAQIKKVDRIKRNEMGKIVRARVRELLLG